MVNCRTFWLVSYQLGNLPYTIKVYSLSPVVVERIWSLPKVIGITCHEEWY